jgi:hypothetical protein
VTVFRKFRSVIIGAACGSALLIGSFSLGQGSVGPIVFAHGEEDVEPVDPAVTFDEGVGIVYAFFEFEGLTAVDILGGVWYQNGETLLTQATTLGQLLGVAGSVPEGKIYFSIVFDDGAPPGLYRLDLSLNAGLVQSAEFTVTAGESVPSTAGSRAGGIGDGSGMDPSAKGAGDLAGHGDLLFEDDFEDSASGWGTASSANGSVGYDTGRLVFRLDGRNQPAVSVHGGIFDDYVIDVEALTLAGPEDNALGVVARYQDNDNYYAFLVSADGYHAVLHFVDGTPVWDQEWQFDRLGEIERGMAGNGLRVLAEGPRLTFLVNGTVRAEVRDALWSSGQIGVFAGVFDEPGVQVGFDRWRVWSLPPRE